MAGAQHQVLAVILAVDGCLRIAQTLQTKSVGLFVSILNIAPCTARTAGTAGRTVIQVQGQRDSLAHV